MIFYPIVTVMAEGVTDASGSPTLEHLRWALTDQRARSVITFTVVQAAISSALTVTLAVPGAYLLSAHGGRSRSLVLAISTVPFVMPPLVLAIGFIPLLGRNGHLNDLIGTLSALSGLDLPSIELLYTKQGIVLAHIFLNFPIALRVLYQRMEAMGQGPIKASRSLRAGPIRTFFRVVLPELRTSMAAALSLVFTYCLLSFGAVLVLGGLSNTTLEVEIFRQMVGHFDTHRAGALLIIEAFFAVCSTVLFLITSKRTHPAMQNDRGPESTSIALTWKGKAISAVYASVVALIVLAPLASVVVSSFSAGPGGSGNLTIQWYGRVLSREDDPVIGSSPLNAVLNSLLIALLSTMVAVTMGSFAASLMDGRHFAGKGSLDTLLLLPIGISTVSLGFGLITASTKGPLDIRGSWTMVVLVHSLISYPMAAMVLLSARRTVPAGLIKAARLLGASRAEVFLNIRLPLLAPGILTASALCFAISIGEMSATMVVAPSGLTTMPLALYRFVAGGRDFGSASAYGVMMLAITAISFIMVHWSVDFMKTMGVGRSD